ncbi:MAG: hypothetical protein EOM22_05505 [Gammaproteobacteria bacterium]|nr:hypothetical protein [Gammaproteobacteria bacterium]
MVVIVMSTPSRVFQYKRGIHPTSHTLSASTDSAEDCARRSRSGRGHPEATAGNRGEIYSPMPRSPILARSAGASGRCTAWTETDSTSNSAETWFRGPTCSRLGSGFSIVLIAIELMASVYMYMMDKSVHVEIMLLIAITALTRKVVVMDLESKGDPALYMLWAWPRSWARWSGGISW